MTADFSHLKAYDPTGRKAWMTLPIAGAVVDGARCKPKLHLLHAGTTNRPYTSAVADYNAKNGGRFDRIDSDVIDYQVEADRFLFPKHVVVGWENVADANGEPVPFSHGACEELFRQLPSWIVLRVSSFAGRPGNFVDEGEPTAEHAKVQAGN